MQDDERLKWKVNGKKELLNTVVFSVTELDCTGPDGQKGKYIVNDAKDWVIVIPHFDDKFLMVKQWRHGAQQISIEFPGGVIDSGETPEEGAVRELREETGCTSGKLVKLGEMNPNPALFSNKVHFYLAEELEFSGKQELDEDEFLDYLEMTETEVYEIAAKGQFCHSLMASALGLYLARKIKK